MNQNLLRCQGLRLYSAELQDDSCIERGVEGAGRSLVQGAVPALTWRRWVKACEICHHSVSVYIWTGELLNENESK